ENILFVPFYVEYGLSQQERAYVRKVRNIRNVPVVANRIHKNGSHSKSLKDLLRHFQRVRRRLLPFTDDVCFFCEKSAECSIRPRVFRPCQWVSGNELVAFRMT